MIEKWEIDSIPVLNVVASENNKQKMPTVIYYHGYNGEKESSLTIAYKIAKEGYRVILPDSLYHGERGNHLPPGRSGIEIWDIIFNNLIDIKTIRNYLVVQQLTDENRIGIGGTSMGGMTTAAALVEYDWLKAAVIVMGNAKLNAQGRHHLERLIQEDESLKESEHIEELLHRLDTYDLSINRDKINNRPILLWHGDKDESIPVTFAEQFYQEVKDSYSDPNDIKLVIEEDRIHNVSKLAIEETAAWFKKQL